MGQSRRLVVVDPGLSGPVGHHADLNRELLPALAADGWETEVWADAACIDLGEAFRLAGLRAVLREAGYIDPRHWCDLQGSLHQARLLHPQLQKAAAGPPVAAWLAHSLLPFQLIGLAQLLQRQPPARVVVSLMFAPGEVFAGQQDHDLRDLRLAAEASSRAALAALAVACERGAHQLVLGAGSRQLMERYAPLCAASGLPAVLLHPAVVAAAPQPAGALGASAAGPRILLHWGERKPDKGRELALAVLAQLLQGEHLPAALQRASWCFHAAGSSLNPGERELIEQLQALPAVTVLEGPIARSSMEAQLGSCDLALLPYCPLAYAERSSGILWLYASARLSQGQAARVVGCRGGWLEREARDLNLGWQALPADATGQQALQAIADGLAADPGAAGLNGYARELFGQGFGSWLADRIGADNLS